MYDAIIIVEFYLLFRFGIYKNNNVVTVSGNFTARARARVACKRQAHISHVAFFCPFSRQHFTCVARAHQYLINTIIILTFLRAGEIEILL